MRQRALTRLPDACAQAITLTVKAHIPHLCICSILDYSLVWQNENGTHNREAWCHGPDPVPVV